VTTDCERLGYKRIHSDAESPQDKALHIWYTDFVASVGIFLGANECFVSHEMMGVAEVAGLLARTLARTPLAPAGIW
jgi:hypothetical protein